MPNNGVGYHEDPKNGDGIIRARTTRQIRSWEIPRTLRALEKLNEEMGNIEFPGNYILFDNMKIYVGEAKNIYSRLKTHSTNPDDKIKNWNKALVISDGRPATQSDFNDNVVRLALELYLIRLFKANKYRVVSQGQKTNLNPIQKHITSSLIQELNHFLLKKNIINKVLEDEGLEEVFTDVPLIDGGDNTPATESVPVTSDDVPAAIKEDVQSATEATEIVIEEVKTEAVTE